MFIKFTPKIPHMKVIPLLPAKSGNEGYSFDNDSVTLRPGTNEITDEEWAAIQPHIKGQIGKEIEPFTVASKTDAAGNKIKAKTMKDVPVGTARKIIQGCQDPKTLKKWFNQELPDELLLVLSKRMRKLKIEPDDLEDEDTDLGLKDGITPEEETTPEPKADTSEDGDTTDDEDEDEGTASGDGEDGEDGEGNLDEGDDIIPDFDGSRSRSGDQE